MLSMQSTSRPAYLPWVDITRIVAIFFVVVVHVSYQLVLKWGSIPFDWWMLGNIVDGCSRTAVSLFFMISGYLNLIHPMPWREYFKKRLPRLLILLVTWSLLHMFLLAYTGQREYTLVAAFEAILSGTVYDHLWFMYSLFGFYLITPVFWKLVESDRAIIWYYLALWVFFEPLAFFIDRFVGFELGVFLPQATGYFGFYLLGYLLGTCEFSRRQSWLGFCAWVIASLFIIFGTWALTASMGETDVTFYYINGFPVLIGAIGLFIFIKSINIDRPIIRLFGTTTTGIYLMHYIIIDLVKRGLLGVKLSAFHPNPYLGMPLTVIVVFLLSALITWILLRIPILRRTVS
jgi:surface polysaccharide O-acyltransferase-like enzyme